MENLKRILAEQPFFEGMDSSYLDIVVGCASNVAFREGQYLYREGESADRFYLVRQGCVALQAYAPGKGATTIATLGEGEVVGWSWLVDPHNARFDALALTPVRAIALDGYCLRGKCDRDHELGYQMFTRVARIMDQRIHSFRLQMLDFYASPY